MIWYEDKKISIIFDKVPSVMVTYPCPLCDRADVEKILKKPFLNREDLTVEINFKGFSAPFYKFTIPKNYSWDGATIPRVFWRLIGPNTSPEFLIPSLIHDVLCENHHYINENRYLSTIIFERLLYVSGVNPFKRWTIKHAVDNYQKIAGNWGRCISEN